VFIKEGEGDEKEQMKNSSKKVFFIREIECFLKAGWPKQTSG